MSATAPTANAPVRPTGSGAPRPIRTRGRSAAWLARLSALCVVALAGLGAAAPVSVAEAPPPPAASASPSPAAPSQTATAQIGTAQTAIAMHGAPALAPGFTHFPYVNADAPKGGRVTLGVLGSFDSLNPLIVRGAPVAGIRELVVETLMARSLDEPFSLYGLLAQSVDMPADRSEITFNLDPRAHFSDGRPLTADDVLFSFEVLRDRGRPNHRTYYKKVTRAERRSDHAVRFVFDGSGDREIPLILALMPVLPKHLLTPDSFERTTLDTFVGSGPYRIARVDPGRGIVYERDRDYWGRDLPVNRGRFNFDEVRYEYFRDNQAMFEALKSGEITLRLEEDPSTWAERYDIPAVADGRLVKAEMPIGVPAGMNGLVFNTRRPVFADPRVRRALIRLFDFEWVNKSLFSGLYKRTESYFERSALSSANRPASERERTLLAPWMASVRPEVLDGRPLFPTTSGDGRNRDNQRAALALLRDAGYRLADGRLVDGEGRQLAFEILCAAPLQARIVAGFVADLQRLGAAPRVRIVDSAQYQSRLKSYDFDMIQNAWPASLSPGNEQLFRWSAKVARVDGSYNYAGVESPAVDAMIGKLLEAVEPDDFTAAVRALDRVLLSGDYVIPLFHLPSQWIAYWATVRPPDTTPLYGYNLDTWWSTGTRGPRRHGDQQ